MKQYANSKKQNANVKATREFKNAMHEFKVLQYQYANSKNTICANSKKRHATSKKQYANPKKQHAKSKTQCANSKKQYAKATSVYGRMDFFKRAREGSPAQSALCVAFGGYIHVPIGQHCSVRARNPGSVFPPKPQFFRRFSMGNARFSALKKGSCPFFFRHGGRADPGNAGSTPMRGQNPGVSLPGVESHSRVARVANMAIFWTRVW